jgi:hypothetical protein
MKTIVERALSPDFLEALPKWSVFTPACSVMLIPPFYPETGDRPAARLPDNIWTLDKRSRRLVALPAPTKKRRQPRKPPPNTPPVARNIENPPARRPSRF